jgi:hypothetical protein
MTVDETIHRGVRWRRDERGKVSFYDADGKRWVAWSDKGDNPPLPPGWSLLGVPTRVTRPGWRSRWRMVPVVVVVLAVVIAVLQATRSSGNQAKSLAPPALVGKCLAQQGTVDGQPVYSATPVPCDAKNAAIRVTQVLPTGPEGGGGCSAGEGQFSLSYPGVKYPYEVCTELVHPPGR